ncbi:MAG: hypothetical protein ACOYN0_14495 [Phycisphaerales bacterium]
MSAKKKTSGRRVAAVAAAAPAGTQTAAERKTAEAQLRSLITKFAPDHLRLATAVRRSLRKRLPSAYEVVYEYRSWFVISYSPTGQGYEGVLAIRGDADGLKLYFNQGKDLPDPEKLLQGSSQTRWIQVERASTVARPAVADLIEAAIAHNRVPFAAEGQGPVVFRSATAKKSSRRKPG